MNAVFEKATNKSKEINTLEKQIGLIQKQINALQSRLGSVKDDRSKSVLIDKLAELEQKKIEYKEKLSRLGG